jgi:hypothetical protein
MLLLCRDGADGIDAPLQIGAELLDGGGVGAQLVFALPQIPVSLVRRILPPGNLPCALGKVSVNVGAPRSEVARMLVRGRIHRSFVFGAGGSEFTQFRDGLDPRRLSSCLRRGELIKQRARGGRICDDRQQLVERRHVR